MTTTTEPILFADNVEVPAGLDPARPCQKEGCDSFVPFGAHMARKYCEAHYVGAGGKVRDARAKNEKPPKLVVEMGGKASKKTDAKERQAAQTAEGAQAFAMFVATTLAVSGDEVCAGAITAGAPAWSQSVGELSKYQPWLTKFFAPVSGENQLGAWLGFILATGTMVLPVLAHHNLLPASVGAKLGGVYVAAAQHDPDQQAAV